MRIDQALYTALVENQRGAPWAPCPELDVAERLDNAVHPATGRTPAQVHSSMRQQATSQKKRGSCNRKVLIQKRIKLDAVARHSGNTVVKAEVETEIKTEITTEIKTEINTEITTEVISGLAVEPPHTLVPQHPPRRRRRLPEDELPGLRVEVWSVAEDFEDRWWDAEVLQQGTDANKVRVRFMPPYQGCTLDIEVDGVVATRMQGQWAKVKACYREPDCAVWLAWKNNADAIAAV